MSEEEHVGGFHSPGSLLSREFNMLCKNVCVNVDGLTNFCSRIVLKVDEAAM